jgi:hypothetical protein
MSKRLPFLPRLDCHSTNTDKEQDLPGDISFAHILQLSLWYTPLSRFFSEK